MEDNLPKTLSKFCCVSRGEEKNNKLGFRRLKGKQKKKEKEKKSKGVGPGVPLYFLGCPNSLLQTHLFIFGQQLLYL